MTEDKTELEFIQKVFNGEPTPFDELIKKAAIAEYKKVTEGMSEIERKVYRMLVEIRYTLMLCGGITYKEIEEIVNKNLLGK